MQTTDKAAAPSSAVPPPLDVPRPSPFVSHGAGFWLVGYAFTVVMAFAAVPTPLYVLYAQRDHLSSTLITCVFAAYAVGVVVSLFTVGHISDWVGRRRMLLVALALALTAGMLFIVWTSLAALLVARVVSGLAVGIITTTATAHLAELHARHRPGASARRAEVVAVAANLGGIGLGPLAAGLLAQFAPDPLRVPYVVTEGLLLMALVGLVFTPETVWRADPVSYRTQRLAVPRQARATFGAAALGAAVTFTILGMFSALVPSFLATALHEHSHAVAGSVASVVFLASAAAQLVNRDTRRSPLTSAVAIAVAGLTVLTIGTWAGQLTVFVSGAVVTGVGAGLVFKTLLAAVVAVSPESSRGEVLASFFLAAYVGLAVPVVALGILAEFVSTSTLMTIFAVAASAGLACVARRLGRASSGTHRTTSPRLRRLV
jgi:MFS family permease